MGLPLFERRQYILIVLSALSQYKVVYNSGRPKRKYAQLYCWLRETSTMDHYTAATTNIAGEQPLRTTYAALNESVP